MEPISTALAGIALVKSAVDGIKSAIGTANDIGDIAGQIDALFTGQKQVNEARNKKSGVGIKDQFGVESVAREVIDAKIAAEKLQEVATMVNMRFGPNTWKNILEERQKRIQEAKEAAAAEHRRKLQESREFEEMMKQLVLAASIVVISMGLFVYLFAVIQ
ncbi:MAG: hypothetical protein CMD92_05225 [Gammaproteobacteria bacterium]|nr:hypothetical protein [Gammaproteobacteria bacterium]|tara:strand:+ start:1547 stop:2029 length:483 start_codon:yes stop_codon:yes gene_type:complete